MTVTVEENDDRGQELGVVGPEVVAEREDHLTATGLELQTVKMGSWTRVTSLRAITKGFKIKLWLKNSSGNGRRRGMNTKVTCSGLTGVDDEMQMLCLA